MVANTDKGFSRMCCSCALQRPNPEEYRYAYALLTLREIANYYCFDRFINFRCLYNVAKQFENYQLSIVNCPLFQQLDEVRNISALV